MAAPLALVAALSLVGHGWRAARATEVASAQMGPSRDWRLFGVELSVLEGGEPAGRLREAAAARLALPEEELEAVTLVRRSLDARQQRTSGRRGRPTGKHEAVWSHVLDVRVSATAAKRIKAKSGRCVPAAGERVATEGQPQVWVSKGTSSGPALLGPLHVVVIGAGPCGLFAALQLARAGVNVTLCERGKPVEQRGRSIGALIRRGLIDPESNFCYGEGGAGTWSDGKLTTRIGRNSEEVRQVLETLVHFGAPPRILIDGAPHLGTDNLVRLLKNFRSELLEHGVNVLWDARVEEFCLEPSSNDGQRTLDELSGSGDVSVHGVKLASGEQISCDAVVVAAGHSARELYTELLRCGATLIPKDFAAGFRIEHPQELINRARYGELAPFCAPVDSRMGADETPQSLPPAAYRLATNIKVGDETGGNVDAGTPPGAPPRGVYSFCMCPGGQIVPTSLDVAHLCVNGMSYSSRGSPWANSAVVVTVGASHGDFDDLRGALPPALAGLEWQETMEERAAKMGGGQFKCPVQRVSDFLAGRPSAQEDLPESSYRLGVTAASLHELYPPAITDALRQGIAEFGQSMPGFDSSEGLLHAVETRTSAPVQVVRREDTCEAIGLRGLYPAGEGAGYAGGIVSAAVDGLRVAKALLKHVGGRRKAFERTLGDAEEALLSPPPI